MTTISCPLIVKNEAPRIKRCLHSLFSFADEIIVMDTGSTDGTQDILDACDGIRWFRSRRFTAETPAEEFDFSQARNEVLDECEREWILSVDADEVVEQDGFREYLDSAEDETDCVGVHLRCEKGSLATVPRCFRNRRGILWFGKYHDTPDPWDVSREVIAPESVICLVNDRLADRSRAKRNLTLLKEQFDSERKITATVLRIADEYRVLGARFAGEALGYYRLYLDAHMGDVGQFNPYVMFSIGECYLRMGVLHSAIDQFLQVIYRWPTYVYAMALLGDCHLKLSQYDIAMAYYQRALGVAKPMPMAPSILTPISRTLLEKRIVYCAAKLDGFKGRLHESEGHDPCCERPEVAQAAG